MSQPRVLVVDDDEDLRELMQIKLASIGYDVHTRSDGTSGLAAVGSLQPDLVVLDWMMPGRNGIEVLEAVRADPDTAQTPVLLVTAKVQADDISAGARAGASDYLAKPFSLRDLAERVASLVGSPTIDGKTAGIARVPSI